ncbi:HAD family hydrolase [Alkalihalobacterium bogoriense]|uniref:HAD family hydrolase n=1 Tax=Alkalihalobacterium bogoriense TaxID=246272 RepID=UPI0004798260|nr:HAD family hydrolase [Alkalihalobacterium bogoriense]
MDSIIFDLDGTLWDSSSTVLMAWNEILNQHPKVQKKITLEDLHDSMGLQIHEIGQKLFPYLQEDERIELLQKCGEVENDYLRKLGGKLYDQVEHVLQTLSKKYKLFIVSNCQEGYIEAFFHFHNVGKYFLDYENPGRSGLSKGENIKLVMGRNQLNRPIYIGDTEGDVKAARLANIPFVYAAYGFGDVSESDETIENFADLLELYG